MTSPATRSFEVVIVGGGTGGLSVAARLAAVLPPGAIALVEPSDKHYYQPLWTLVGAGVVQQGDDRARRGRLRARRRGVDPRQGRRVLARYAPGGAGRRGAHRLPAPGRRARHPARLAQDRRRDRGARPGRRGVELPLRPGRLDLARPAHARRAATRSSPSRRRRSSAPARRRRSCTWPTSTCAGAASAIGRRSSSPRPARHLRGRALRPQPAQGRRAQGHRDPLPHRPGGGAPGEREAVFKQPRRRHRASLRYELLHVVPPQSAPDVIKRSPLAWPTPPAGSTSTSTRCARPLPRRVVARRLLQPADLAHRRRHSQAGPGAGREPARGPRRAAPTARYDGYASCPLVTGYGKLILAEFDYDGKPGESRSRSISRRSATACGRSRPTACPRCTGTGCCAGGCSRPGNTPPRAARCTTFQASFHGPRVQVIPACWGSVRAGIVDATPPMSTFYVEPFFDPHTYTLTFVVYDGDPRRGRHRPGARLRPGGSADLDRVGRRGDRRSSPRRAAVHYVLETHAHADHLSARSR
jgi:sulfide:quinone oxidoreductase